jgi:hypothetical protein
MFKKVLMWLRGIFQTQPTRYQGEKHARALPPIRFAQITSVGKPPKNEYVERGKLYCVVVSGRLKWSLFICPCGCGNVVTLSLQSLHSPSWALTETESGRPTLHPSVWRDKGCLSHFWIRDGRVFWCADTGTHPSLRRRQ